MHAPPPPPAALFANSLASLALAACAEAHGTALSPAHHALPPRPKGVPNNLSEQEEALRAKDNKLCGLPSSACRKSESEALQRSFCGTSAVMRAPTSAWTCDTRASNASVAGAWSSPRFFRNCSSSTRIVNEDIAASSMRSLRAKLVGLGSFRADAPHARITSSTAE
eukprot:CAMPEP_0170262070 /NCGR_PEP_ID=MMETSP0116_2-20130129/30918_1 /TAXON_ID=400756 /ORGANISM="Durinskia baltica, Strain CSIRO CS-38" /LENGTH=166 /DNA_ID=CAMNT_0010513139 /DNA_START=183 /DNA_END=683 /DNA_ORIENTATION=-